MQAIQFKDCYVIPSTHPKSKSGEWSVETEQTKGQSWVKVKELPELWTANKGSKSINPRWELKPMIKPTKELPQTLPDEAITTVWDYDTDSNIVEGTHAHLIDYYHRKTDGNETITEEIPVEWEIVAVVKSDMRDIPTWSYTGKMNHYTGKNFVYEVKPSAPEFFKIFVPEPALQDCPCEVKGEDLYRIIREHVKLNINREIARITSDYDFHFAVEKFVETPFGYKVSVFDKTIGRGKNKTDIYKDIEKLKVTAKVLDIGTDGRYGSKVEGMQANSWAELEEKVDSMLENLMNKTNKPVSYCTCCKGTGIQPE